MYACARTCTGAVVRARDRALAKEHIPPTVGFGAPGRAGSGRYFAAQGYASLHVQHVGSDRQLWRGNPLAIVSRLSDAAQETEALNRVKDVKFAVDSVLSEPVCSIINTQRLVAAGHSYGANTTSPRSV